jgi:imidazolonepropionase-like amidohydrolase
VPSPPPALRLPLVLAALGGIAAWSRPASPAAPAPAEWAFIDVSLVPLDSDRVLPHRTVLVRNGRIAAIARSDRLDLPPSARVVDGRGRYLMPGLTDLHIHLFESRDLLLYLANGVTTVRNLGGGGSADTILAIRREVAAGTRLGPTIFTSGNWLDGDPPYRPINTVLRTPEEARAEVGREARAGYDFVKVYATLSPEVYREITLASREWGIPVTGHIPGPVGLAGVLSGGQVSVDHVAQFVGQGEPATIAAAVREAGMSVVSTLVMARRAGEMRGTPSRVEELLALPSARYLSPATRRFWREAPFTGMPRAKVPDPLYLAAEEQVRAFRAAGVAIMTGTDAGLWGNPPGYSEVEEVRLLVEAGLTPFEALRAATVVPAAFLDRWVRGADQPGVMREGNRADLILLESNPLADPRALEHRAGVMVRGTWLPADTLSAMLDALAAQYAAEAKHPD